MSTPSQPIPRPLRDRRRDNIAALMSMTTRMSTDRRGLSKVQRRRLLGLVLGVSLTAGMGAGGLWALGVDRGEFTGWVRDTAGDPPASRNAEPTPSPTAAPTPSAQALARARATTVRASGGHRM